MRERLIFYSSVEVESPSGATTTSWVETYRCAASIKRTSPIYVKDGVVAREMFSGASVSLVIRKAPVTDAMRVKYDGNMYDVISPVEPNHLEHTLTLNLRRINE